MRQAAESWLAFESGERVSEALLAHVTAVDREPALAKFAVTRVKEPVLEVNILMIKPNGLAYAQSSHRE
jgi:hypothetical protein